MDMAIAWQYIQENPAIIVGVIALLWIIYLIARRIKRNINKKRELKKLKKAEEIYVEVPTPPPITEKTFVRPPVDFDLNIFNLEENKPLTTTKDITGGLLERAETLRKELDANAALIEKQLEDIRSMKKEVADTALILKNYFQDLGKKELLLKTTLNSMGGARRQMNGGKQ